MQIRFGIFYKRKFSPRSAAEISAAVGDLSKLDIKLMKTFMPGVDFKPITASDISGEGAWLANHYEPGQTFKEYEASSPNVPDKARCKIYLQPLELFTGESLILLDKLKMFTRIFFVMPVEILKPLELKSRSRINNHTKKLQLLTGDLLSKMERNVPPDAYCVLGITMTDLYPNYMWNFVFGQAMLSRRVGVYSLARYDPFFFGKKREPGWDTLFLNRSIKVLAHEAIHMFGVYHCVHYKCLMNGSNSMDESDSAPMFLCPVCLRKLHYAAKFDPAERYRKLMAFYNENSMSSEVMWIKKRLEFIEAK
ncbi:MAG TPA: archaemetzincin [Candidatus Wallbacteria bacterium]|nr:archaemetzincin [Candidatus Wallbacteria bacterium]